MTDETPHGRANLSVGSDTGMQKGLVVQRLNSKNFQAWSIKHLRTVTGPKKILQATVEPTLLPKVFRCEA